MSEWTYYDKEKLRDEIQPDILAARAGFYIYDEKKRTNKPSYYGIILVRKAIQRNMMRDGINGGYFLQPKVTARSKVATHIIVLAKKEDYDKAITYPNYGHAIFPDRNYNVSKNKAFDLEFEELLTPNHNLRPFFERGASVSDISIYLDITPDEVVQTYLKQNTK